MLSPAVCVCASSLGNVVLLGLSTFTALFVFIVSVTQTLHVVTKVYRPRSKIPVAH